MSSGTKVADSRQVEDARQQLHLTTIPEGKKKDLPSPMSPSTRSARIGSALGFGAHSLGHYRHHRNSIRMELLALVSTASTSIYCTAAARCSRLNVNTRSNPLLLQDPNKKGNIDTEQLVDFIEDKLEAEERNATYVRAICALITTVILVLIGSALINYQVT